MYIVCGIWLLSSFNILYKSVVAIGIVSIDNDRTSAQYTGSANM